MRRPYEADFGLCFSWDYFYNRASPENEKPCSGPIYNVQRRD